VEKTIAALGVPPPPPPETDVVLGVKIRPEGFANLTSRGFNPSFVEEHFAPMDPIFVTGDLCPVTEFYGIPILILFQPRPGGLGDENFPALKLYIGGAHGENRPGLCVPFALDACYPFYLEHSLGRVNDRNLLMLEMCVHLFC
jgi:hypothetical protein